MPKIAEEARAARRDQIVAAAAECFARSGYHVTTMADIAEAAGVSKGTPYLYFPSKEALFIALYEEWDCGLAVRVNAAVSALPEPARSPRAVLAAVASAIAAHVLDNPQTCRVLMEATTLAAYEPAIAAKVQAANAGNLDQLTGLFEA
ncbi:MAG: TetR/AcrR family transcriptional regulator, partial [Streptosporangiaceae bacterium]